MNTSTNDESPPVDTPPEAPKILSEEGKRRAKVLLEVITVWKERVKILGLVRGSNDYYLVQNEFWLGACLMANALGMPQNPVIVVYLMARRDILDLEEGLRERIA